MKRALLILVVAIPLSACADAGAAPTSLGAGVYSKEQAEIGKAVFSQNCSSCHNADYYKTVLQTWRGQPMTYLFEQVLSAMPADKPGALLETEYEDAFAYIFELVGFPAGETRLEYANGMMNDISLEPAPK